MKCISVYQPWATLILNGLKRYETRAWATSYRGPLAIHASKKWGAGQSSLCWLEPFRTALQQQGPSRMLPRGVLLGTVELLDCIPTTQLLDEQYPPLSARERAFGDFRPGRVAWLLVNPKPFARPIPLDGQLGIFEIADAPARVPEASCSSD